VSGSYYSAEGFQALGKAISAHEVSKNSAEGPSQRLFYLTLPPSTAIAMLRSIFFVITT
jgi:glucose-6-phosphate 1-dehydrogenase